MADADQVIFVPFFELEPRLAGGFLNGLLRPFSIFIKRRPLSAECQRVPAMLVIKPHQPRADAADVQVIVDLISGDVPAIGQQLAAKLKTVVDRASPRTRDLSFSSKSAN